MFFPEIPTFLSFLCRLPIPLENVLKIAVFSLFPPKIHPFFCSYVRNLCWSRQEQYCKMTSGELFTPLSFSSDAPSWRLRQRISSLQQPWLPAFHPPDHYCRPLSTPSPADDLPFCRPVPHPPLIVTDFRRQFLWPSRNCISHWLAMPAPARHRHSSVTIPCLFPFGPAGLALDPPKAPPAMKRAAPGSLLPPGTARLFCLTLLPPQGPCAPPASTGPRSMAPPGFPSSG